jgi:hypothetical protein
MKNKDKKLSDEQIKAIKKQQEVKTKQVKDNKEICK